MKKENKNTNKANSLLEKLKKNSANKRVELLSESVILVEKDTAPTPVPMINVALGGHVKGGIGAGITTIAGPSKHFKTSFGLVMVAGFLDKYEDGVCLFYNNEFGAKKSYFEAYGVDTERVIHTPFSNIEELKFDIMKQLKELEEKENVIILIDSVGNAASVKEVEDALAEKSAADMTRAKQLKSLTRMITPELYLKNIPLIAINHTYQTQEMFSKTVVGGGCLVAGTKIIMTDGTTKEIENIQVGDVVKTRLGDNKVIATWNPESEGFDGKDRECLEIEFEDGYKVTCTENHKFFYNGEWVEAKDLYIGSFVEKYNNPLLYEKYLVGSVCENNVNLSINRDTTIGKTTTTIVSITKVENKNVYDISVDGEPSYVLENGIISHNTGIMYASDSVFVVGKNQLKEGDEITGSKFILTIEKSRFVKERSKLPITVRWDSGIAKWSGFEDLAEEWGIITKCRVSRSLGYEYESISKGKLTVKASDIDSADEFWNTILEETDIKERIEQEYKIGKPKALKLEVLDEDLEISE
jgi:RecA/RadA recombinase